MLKHREDSIKEINEKKGELTAIAEKADLALDCIAELGEMVAPLIEAASQGGDE